MIDLRVAPPVEKVSTVMVEYRNVSAASCRLLAGRQPELAVHVGTDIAEVDPQLAENRGQAPSDRFRRT